MQKKKSELHNKQLAFLANQPFMLSILIFFYSCYFFNNYFINQDITCKLFTLRTNLFTTSNIYQHLSCTFEMLFTNRNFKFIYHVTILDIIFNWKNVIFNWLWPYMDSLHCRPSCPFCLRYFSSPFENHLDELFFPLTSWPVFMWRYSGQAVMLILSFVPILRNVWELYNVIGLELCFINQKPEISIKVNTKRQSPKIVLNFVMVPYPNLN